MSAKYTPESIAFQEAVKAMFKTAHETITPNLPPNSSDSEVHAIVIQNVMRSCLEVCLQQVIPYQVLLLESLALRLSSYAISAAPLEYQDLMVERVTKSLPRVHKQRVAVGAVIQTEWGPDLGTQ